jgi:hypothetical protein
METHHVIIVTAVLLFTVVGFLGCIAYLFYYFKERNVYNAIKPQSDLEYKPTGSFITSDSMKYIPTGTPYKDLWEAAGCSILDMSGYHRTTWALTPMSGDSGKVKERDEILYRGELLSLIEKGRKYREVEKNNPELRKFCIEHTMPTPGNEYRDTVGMLRTTDMLYNYILSGKIPENKKEE